MKQYFVIQNVSTKQYLCAMSTVDYTESIEECGKWSNHQAALEWIREIENIYFTIITIYCN